MRQPLLRALAVSLACAACGDVDGPPSRDDPPRFDLGIEADKPQYSLAADSVALVTVTNRSDRAVYLPMNVYVVCERLRDAAWRDEFAWFSVDGTRSWFSLAPGSALTDELQLWFYLPERPGTYRFRYFVYTNQDLRSLLPIEERVSPPFVLTP